jgi:hypothetical protein
VSGHTYPRKWFRVSEYGGAIKEREFIRETDKMLVFAGWNGKESRTPKASSYEVWYPEREEAEAVLAAIKARREATAAAERVRRAAPELLEALEGICRIADQFADEAGLNLEGMPQLRDACAAIARARGEAS